jgi:hypothetical protein
MGEVYVRVIPPPPPTATVVGGAVTAFIAAGAAFLGYNVVAGVFAVISAVADIAYLVQIRGQYWVPKEAIGADGKLKTGKVDMSGKSEKP